MSPQHQGWGILDAGDTGDDWKEIKQPGVVAMEATRPKPDWRPISSQPAKHYLRRVRSLIFPKSRPPEKLRRTAYLDGLRGFAAFLVYWHHHELWAHESNGTTAIFDSGFGRDGRRFLCALPGVRTLFTGGHFAVAVFFVISGYVLSAKPLGFMHDGRQGLLGDNLASALFRRWLRLYIPLVCTTFLYMLSWHALGRPLRVQGAEPQGGLRDEMWNWYAEFKNFSFVFTTGGKPWFSYNFHTWSIPVEMKGSIVVYTALQALSRVTTSARLACTAALAFYFLYIADGWYGAAFLAGMLLCDLDLLSARGELPGPLARPLSRLGEPQRRFLCYHLLAAGIYLGGVPAATLDVADLGKNRGWYYLSLLKPQAVFDYKWFYLLWAAVLVVAAVPRVAPARRFFESRFCQHLGRVSYALYLVHGPVLWLLGDRVYAAVGWHREWHAENIPGWIDWLRLPAVGPLGLEFSFLAPHLVLLPLTLWFAEVGTRVFDEPAVRFASWLYGKMLPQPGKM